MGEGEAAVVVGVVDVADNCGDLFVDLCEGFHFALGDGFVEEFLNLLLFVVGVLLGRQGK